MKLGTFRARTWLALVVAALMLGSCGGPTFIVQQYSGDVRPRETIGIFRVNGTDTTQLEAFDGEPANVMIAEDSRLHIEVLPGEHSVLVRSTANPLEPPERARFVAEANKVYRAVFQAGVRRDLDSEPVSARVFEVDRGSDAFVRDVTIERRRALEETRVRTPSPVRSASVSPAQAMPDAADAGAPPPTDGGAAESVPARDAGAAPPTSPQP